MGKLPGPKEGVSIWQNFMCTYGNKYVILIQFIYVNNKVNLKFMTLKISLIFNTYLVY